MKNKCASFKVQVEYAGRLQANLTGFHQESGLASHPLLPEDVIQLFDPVRPGVALLDDNVPTQECPSEDPGLCTGANVLPPREDRLLEQFQFPFEIELQLTTPAR